MDNIVEFKPKEQSEEQCKCEHCEIREDIVQAMFFSILKVIKNSKSDEDLIDLMIDKLNEYYFDIFEEGKRAGFSELIGYSQYRINQLDGVEEEE